MNKHNAQPAPLSSHVAISPIDIDDEALIATASALDWLIDFINQRLKESPRWLVLGQELRVHFMYRDLIYSYSYLGYWRDHYQDIAAFYREQGWEVIEYASYNPMHRADEEQPMLGFKLALS